MLIVSWLEGSIALAFFVFFKSFFGEHSTHYSQAWILEQRHLSKEGKKPSFHIITWKRGDIQSHLLEWYAFGSKCSVMLSNRNWTYVEDTTIWGRARELLC